MVQPFIILWQYVAGNQTKYFMYALSLLLYNKMTPACLVVTKLVSSQEMSHSNPDKSLDVHSVPNSLLNIGDSYALPIFMTTFWFKVLPSYGSTGAPNIGKSFHYHKMVLSDVGNVFATTFW